ncbi:MAG: type II secretion system F family protein [Eubacteriales bacterium]|nr:type II secretion system F family protein [Eubacteriales bacterium]
MRRILSNSEKIAFCEQMAMVLKSGISVTEGIMMMKEDVGDSSPTQKKLYEELYERMEETGMFYEALEESEAFPDYMVHMIRIGEQTGHMDEVMAGLAAYYEREEGMKQDIKNALSYPLLMLGMMGVIVLVMMVKVLPVFAQVYEQLGGQMSGMAAVLLRVGMGIRSHYGLVIAITLLIVGGIFWLAMAKKGRKLLQKTVLRFLFARKIAEKIGVARFASGMSMALGSGMNYEDAFHLVEALMKGSRSMADKMKRCKEKMEEGESLSRAASEAGILKGLDARILFVAERTGETDQALAQIASRADEEVSVRIQNIVSVLEPTLVAVLSVLVGAVLLSVMVPLMGVLSSIA